MGIVQRQGIQNAFFTYAGIVLGYINKFLLFSKILGFEKMGLADMLLSSALILSEVSRFGAATMVIRFFPYFSHTNTDRKAFTFITTLLYPLTGFLFFTLIFLLFKDNILGIFSEKSPLYAQYYFYIFPIAFGLTFFQVFYTFAQSHLKTVLPTALFEVGNKLFHTVAVLAFWKGYVQLNGFLAIYSVGYIVTLAILWLYLVWLKRWEIVVSFDLFNKRIMRIAIRYGLFSFLARSTSILIENSGILQMGEFLGEKKAGIYAIATYIALMIYIPSRAIGNVVLPLVTRHLRNRDYKELEAIYKKTSLNGLIFGSLLFVGIWINLDDLFAILKLDFEDGKWVFLFLGIARMLDVANGVNATIVVCSRYYVYNLYSSLLLLVMILVLNYLLIPLYGGIGAGIASALSLLIYNTLNTSIVWWKFRMLPFSIENIYTFAFAGLCLLIGLYIPSCGNVLADMMIRSLAVTLVFAVLILQFGISSDLNGMWGKIKQKVKK